MQIKHIVKIFSLYFLASLPDQFCGNKVLFPLFYSTPVSRGKEYSVCGIKTAVFKVTAHSLCGSGTVELQVTEYAVCGSGTSLHRIFCVWNISGSLCNGQNDMSAQGPQALGSKPSGGAVIYCSILAVAPTEIFVCFLRYYHAVTNQLTYDKDPDIRHTS